MHYSKIEAANVPSLFDVYHENASLCGKSGKTGPRAAVAQEIRAYSAWLASKAGLYPFSASEVIGGGIAWRAKHHSPVMGVTYGEQRGRNAETREYEYEPGSYSIPFPGRNAHRDKVTLETLNDAGEVIATSTLPVEPKKGGVVWDRDTVRKIVGKVEKPSRGKRVAPVSVESPAPVETPPAVAQEPAPVQDCTPEAVTTPDGPEIAPHEASATNREISADLSTDSAPMTTEQRDLSTTLDLAEQVAALAATVAAMQSALDAIQAAPPAEGMTVAPPVGGKQRTAGHERAIRRAWAMRQDKRGAESIAASAETYARSIERIANTALYERNELKRKRRRAVLFARDLQKRLNEAKAMAIQHRDARNNADDRANGLAFDLRKETRRANEAAKDALRVSDIIRARDVEIATLKAKPHHMGQEVRPDDYQRLVQERDEARASLTSDREKLRIMRANLERGTDVLDMMTDRALRAENALRAVEQRQARADTPIRATVRAVTFGRAA